MTSEPTEDPEVFNDTGGHRYHIVAGSQLAGFAAYDPGAESVVFTHTVIEAPFEGKGFGSRLAKAALDDVRRQGKTVVPRCPFIAAYIRRHPAYLDLVDDETDRM